MFGKKAKPRNPVISRVTGVFKLVRLTGVEPANFHLILPEIQPYLLLRGKKCGNFYPLHYSYFFHPDYECHRKDLRNYTIYSALAILLHSLRSIPKISTYGLSFPVLTRLRYRALLFLIALMVSLSLTT